MQARTQRRAIAGAALLAALLAGMLSPPTVSADLPPAPWPIEPPNLATDVPSGPDTVLAWVRAVDPDGDAVTYEWAVGEDWQFRILVATGSGETATDVTFLTEPGTTYFWRVRAHDGTEPGPYSPIFWFTTAAAPTSRALFVGVESPDRVGVAGATVELRDAADRLVDVLLTTAGGRGSFLDVPYGTYTVYVTAPGYATATKRVTVAADGGLDLTLTLTESDGTSFGGYVLLAGVGIAAFLAFFQWWRLGPPEDDADGIPDEPEDPHAGLTDAPHRPPGG